MRVQVTTTGLAVLTATALLLGTGCEDHGDTAVALEYTSDDGGVYYGPYAAYEQYPRYAYAVNVRVLDPYGFAAQGVAVEIVVADITETRAVAYTNRRGYAGFDVLAQPGVVISVFINDYRYMGDYLSVVTTPDTLAVNVTATLAW